MSKQPSRGDRWRAGLDQLSKAMSEVEAAENKVNEALSDLRDIQSEYQEWLDNLPENLQGSALGEKLEAITGLDLEDVSFQDEVQGKCDEVEGAELPLGFGRD